MYIERGFYFPINTTPCFKMFPICKKNFWEKFPPILERGKFITIKLRPFLILKFLILKFLLQ
jgi:hypothetical protein